MTTWRDRASAGDSGHRPEPASEPDRTLWGYDDAVRQDPQYRAGTMALQVGDWAAAELAFEGLKSSYPESRLPLRLLEDLQLRSKTNRGRRVRGRIVSLRIWPILVRVTIIALIAGLFYTGARLLTDVVTPIIAEARTRAEAEQVLAEARLFLDAGDYDAAEERFTSVLAGDPEHAESLEALDFIAGERTVLALYAEAVALDTARESDAALALYLELDELRPGYRDIARRIETIQRAKSLTQLYEEATAAYEAGDEPEAIRLYEEVRDRNLSYNQDLVEDRLFNLYLNQGTLIIEQKPPELGQLSTAYNYLSKALALRPRSQVVGRERQLLKLFLDAQAAYYAERWTDAASMLRVVYDTRTQYLGDTTLNMLYDAYVRSGDDYRTEGDSFLAYEQYRKAMELPVEDTTFAQGRMFYVQPFLTPTPTPNPTPTPPPDFGPGGAAPPRPQGS